MNLHRLLIAVITILWLGTASAQKQEIDAPIIVQPFAGSIEPATIPQYMVFIWLRPTLPPGRQNAYSNLNLRYKFELIDMSANHLLNSEDAFNSLAVMPYYVQNNIKSTSLVYNMSKPALKVGHKYAVRITASLPGMDNTRTFRFRNNGRSPVIVFTYGNEEYKLPPATTDSIPGTGQ